MLINKHKNEDSKHYNDSKTFIKCSNDTDDLYEHIDEFFKTRVGFASQVNFCQLGNLVLAPDFQPDLRWLYFYWATQGDPGEYNLCPVTKQKLILKTSDIVKFTLLNTKITFHKLMILRFFLWYETVTVLSSDFKKLS